MFRIWCEWDIGERDVYFHTEELAKEWLENNEGLKEILEDGDTLDDLFADSYVGIEEISIYG